MKKEWLAQIATLIKKEINLEWRIKFAISGILLYVVSTVFTAYLSFKIIPNPAVWNALMWIILLFASVNAVAKSFVQENAGRQLYLYTLVAPQPLIIAKIIYNALLLVLISLLTYLIYSIFIGDIVQDKSYFLITLILGATGFSSVMTLVSAISAKAGNNSTLMAILSFPILLPMLLLLIKISKNAIDGIDHSINNPYLLVLIMMNIIVLVLAYILFPYLWRE